jgi:hypothetical protein
MRRLWAGGGERGGATGVSYAILYGSVLVVVLTLVQVGLWFYGRDLALTAARAGVDLGRSYGTVDPGAAQAHAHDVAARTSTGVLDNPTVTATADATTMTVTVQARVTTLVPGLSLTVSQSSTAAIERLTR